MICFHRDFLILTENEIRTESFNNVEEALELQLCSSIILLQKSFCMR